MYDEGELRLCVHRKVGADEETRDIGKCHTTKQANKIR